MGLGIGTLTLTHTTHLYPLLPTLTLTRWATLTLTLPLTRWARHWRAVKAQAWGIPMLMWWGHCPCSNVPDVESVTVATFDR